MFSTYPRVQDCLTRLTPSKAPALAAREPRFAGWVHYVTFLGPTSLPLSVSIVCGLFAGRAITRGQLTWIFMGSLIREKRFHFLEKEKKLTSLERQASISL